MSTPQRPGSGGREVDRPGSGGRQVDRGRPETATFTRNLRYEFASEEGRALVGSYAISFSLAALFLLFVYLSPLPPEEIEDPYIVVQMPDPEPPPPPPPEPAEVEPAEDEPAPQPRPRPRQPTPRPQTRRETTSAGEVESAFGGATRATGGLAGNPASVLRGVNIPSGTGGTPGGTRSGAAIITGGTGSGTGTTPGIGGVQGDARTGGTIGRVGGAGGLGRSTVRVSAPSVITAPNLREGRDMSDLGTFVRSRQAELRFCYEEHGLKTNPGLAGTITVAIGIAGSGRVTSANITRRTWSGAGVSGVESCVLSRIRAWRFPSSSAGDGTYAFPFNFTR